MNVVLKFDLPTQRLSHLFLSFGAQIHSQLSQEKSNRQQCQIYESWVVIQNKMLPIKYSNLILGFYTR